MFITSDIFISPFIIVGVVSVIVLMAALYRLYRKDPSYITKYRPNILTILASILLLVVVLGLITDFAVFDYFVYKVFRWYDDDGDNSFMLAVVLFPIVATTLSGLGWWYDNSRKKESRVARIIFIVSCIFLLPLLIPFLFTIPSLFIG